MPTGRGVIVALAGLGVWVAGRMLGAPALEQLGFGLLILVAAAVAVLRLGRHELRLIRAVTPQKVTAGREVQVGVRLDNLGEGATPLVLLEDGLKPELGGRARSVLDGLRPGDRRQLRYTIRPQRRGRWSIGPLHVTFRDPFGVARMRAVIGEANDLIVYPRVEALTLPGFATNRRSLARSARRQLTGARGEDFYTLREYAEGDDLRRIHWPATAKRGRYMIRQEETPWQARATVLFDDRPAGHSRASWERTLEVTASLTDLFVRHGYTVTMTGAQSPGRGAGKGTAHLHRCLEALVPLEPVWPRPGGEDAFVGRLGAFAATASGEDILVTVGVELDTAAAEALIRAAARCKEAAVILLEERRSASRSAAERDRAIHTLTAAGIKVLRLPTGSPLAGAWETLWARVPTPAGREGGDPWEPKVAPA